MRLFLVLIFGLTLATPTRAAEVPSSWKVGPWDEQRMKKHEGYELVFFGSQFLNSNTVTQDIPKAEILFEGAAKKDPTTMALIGIIYSSHTNNMVKALAWFSRGIQVGDTSGNGQIGLLMNRTGELMLKRQSSTGIQNPEAIALFFAARHFGNDDAALNIAASTAKLTSSEIVEAKKRSEKYTIDPSLLLKYSNYLCSNKNNNFGQNCFP